MSITGEKKFLITQFLCLLCQTAQRFKSCRSLCRSGFVSSSFDALTLRVQLEVYVVVVFYCCLCLTVSSCFISGIVKSRVYHFELPNSSKQFGRNVLHSLSSQFSAAELFVLRSKKA